MDDGLIYILVILAVIAVVVLFVIYVVLPIIGALLGIGLILMVGIMGAGFISGIFVGIKNFFEVLFEAHSKLP